MMKKLLGFLMSLMMIVTLVSCGQSDLEGEKSGAFLGSADPEMVVLDITSEPMELNSMLVYDAVAMDVLSHVMSGLTKLNAKDEPVADLAESWEINEDNTEYIVYLRKDALWSNGDPVTANDFYFSWVNQLKPETGSYLVPFLYDNIKNGEAFYNGEVGQDQLGIEVIDDYTLKIQWERPTTEGLFLLSLPTFLPVNQRSYEEIGALEYAKEADKIVTNGAYKLATWVHDDHIMLEKSTDYYDEANIFIPKVKLVMISDPNTRLNAFMTGEIDLTNLYSDQIAQIKELDETALGSYFDGGSWYFAFNFNNELLANENLRKALSYSVDIQSLLDNIIADGSVAADGLVPSTISGANGETYASARGKLFAYDLEEAKKAFDLALSELGISADEIVLTLDVANTPYNQNQAAYIVAQWKENLGIDVAVNAQPWQALQEAKWNGDFNISVEVNSASDNSAISFLNLFVAEDNFTGYESKEYDDLVDLAKNEGDITKKQDLMIEAEKMLIDNMVVGPMYFTCTTYAVSDKLEGLVRTPFQIFNVCDGAKIRQ